MMQTIYDLSVDFYVDFVDRTLGDATDFRHLLIERFEEILRGRLAGASVCDVACGEGYLSRHLARFDARVVIGIDNSAELIRVAQRRSDRANLAFRVDDAQRLATIDDASIDIVVSQLAIMDIEDHRALFRSVRRVLRDGGTFVFSLLHPCFEGPFRLPDEPQFLRDAAGRETAVAVRRYASEGRWQSGGDGVRGRVGAHHRMLSTLINDLLSERFVLQRIEEPVEPRSGLFSQVPRSILISAGAERNG
jgi:SAM-dependent methyltransferase